MLLALFAQTISDVRRRSKVSIEALCHRRLVAFCSLE